MSTKKLSCVKCGSTDILVEWHRKSTFEFPNEIAGDTCGEHRSILDEYPREPKEHLHYHCRGCQYEWTGPTLDSKKQKGAR